MLLHTSAQVYLMLYVNFSTTIVGTLRAPITSGSFFQLTHHCTQEMLSVLEGSNNLYTVLPGPQYNLKLFIIVSHAFHRNIFWCARIT